MKTPTNNEAKIRVIGSQASVFFRKRELATLIQGVTEALDACKLDVLRTQHSYDLRKLEKKLRAMLRALDGG